MRLVALDRCPQISLFSLSLSLSLLGRNNGGGSTDNIRVFGTSAGNAAADGGRVAGQHGAGRARRRRHLKVVLLHVVGPGGSRCGPGAGAGGRVRRRGR